jgi:hypothetical protein
VPEYIRSEGPRAWTNVHHTVKTRLAKLIDVYNPGPAEAGRMGNMALLKLAASNLEKVVKDARKAGQRVRAVGAGWALSDIAITDGWLVNTANLNGCFDVPDKYFDARYKAEKRGYLVVCQCGQSIGELNADLEWAKKSPIRRALKTSGIGNGQTVAGAVSGSTHGSALRFGSTPDFVVGIQLVTGRGKSLWLERASYPVLNDQFVADLSADVIRDDDVFEAAQVSFGSFGIIAALAVETDPIYHLKFPPAGRVTQDELGKTLGRLAKVKNSDTTAPYHYEFIFNPYNRKVILEAAGTRVAFSRDLRTPKPRWQIGGNGLAPGDHLPAAVLRWLRFPKKIAKFQFDWYLENALLENVTGTPGQLFSATISHFEGTVESAFAVSISDAISVVDISSDVVEKLKVPSISQVRIVHPTKSMLGFTRHKPKSAVFEFAMAKDSGFPKFEQTLTSELSRAGIKYTFHWSKNSGLDQAEIVKMHGAKTVGKWRAARDRVFDNDDSLKKTFSNPHLERGGLN